MKVRPFGNVGVEIYDIDVANLNAVQYREIIEIFFSELIVIIRDQKPLALPFAKIVNSFGSIVNSAQCVWNSNGENIGRSNSLDPFNWNKNDSDFPVQRVTGKKVDDKPSGIFGTGVLDWHCNINGITWAPGVGLQAISGVEGTFTSWLDTTRAYDDLDDNLKSRCENVIGEFFYSPEVWAEGLPDWQLQGMISARKSNYRMRLVNKSEKGKKGLYFHYLNNCNFPTDPELLPILKKHCFNSKYIQTVDWRPGDIHLSHQILTLHRREELSQETLENRILNRYTFDFQKVYPDSKQLYLK